MYILFKKIYIFFILYNKKWGNQRNITNSSKLAHQHDVQNLLQPVSTITWIRG